MQGYPQQQQQQQLLPSISPQQFVDFQAQNQFQPISPKLQTVQQMNQFDDQNGFSNNLNINDLIPLQPVNNFSTSGVNNPVNNPMDVNPSGISSFLDLDSQQSISINSGDLRDLSKFLNGMSDEDHMTDSFKGLMKN